MEPGRNDPCPCGSGKKFKRCCLLEDVDYGPCQASLAGGEEYGEPCGKASCGAHVCGFCGKKYGHCPDHVDGSRIIMKGHVLRTHPEKIPRVVAELIAKGGLDRILKLSKKNPALWQKLINYIHEHQLN